MKALWVQQFFCLSYITNETYKNLRNIFINIFKVSIIQMHFLLKILTMMYGTNFKTIFEFYAVQESDRRSELLNWILQLIDYC